MSSKPERDMISPKTWICSLIKWKSPRCMAVLLSFISLFQIIMYAFIAAPILTSTTTPTSNVIINKIHMDTISKFLQFHVIFYSRKFCNFRSYWREKCQNSFALVRIDTVLQNPARKVWYNLIESVLMPQPEL